MDEHHAEPESTLDVQADGSAIAAGSFAVREVNRQLDLALPDGPGWSTVAGLCIHLAGRIPAAGERLAHEDGTVLEVMEAAPGRVLKVRIVPPRQEGQVERSGSPSPLRSEGARG